MPAMRGRGAERGGGKPSGRWQSGGEEGVKGDGGRSEGRGG